MASDHTLPFLDIVFATIGILVTIFALHEMASHAAGRPLAIDHLVICQADERLTLYPDPRAPAHDYTPHQLPALFAQLDDSGSGLRNLVFALTGDCFATRQRFEDALARRNALLPGRADTDPSPPVLRVAFQPLASDPTAAADLLARWRGGRPGNPSDAPD